VILSFLVVTTLDVLSLDFVAEYLILGCNLHSDLVDEESIFRWVLQMVYQSFQKTLSNASRYQSFNEANRST
jgi:hypothetical protein